MFTLRRTTAVITLSLGASIAAAPAALAMRVPDPTGGVYQGPQIVSNGSPIWVFAVVAVLAVLVTLAVTRVTTRLRPTHAIAATYHVVTLPPEPVMPTPEPVMPTQQHAPSSPVDA
jgi:hypothetical protein